jgi:2-C-methyl-D-erythritol 4-phosphate cytidylyltransferase
VTGLPRCWGVVPAAGRGLRMGGEVPKQYLLLRGRSVLDHAIAALLGHAAVRAVVVAVAPDDARWRTSMHAGDPRVRWAEGGAERCHSVLNALDALTGEAADEDWVLVHDAARPCLRAEDLARLVAALSDHPVGGLLGVPARDTMKRCAADGTVTDTVERAGLWHAYTPQMFRHAALRAALRTALAAGVLVTDESAAIERAGLAPRLVEGSPDNIKVTRPEDLPLAAFLLDRLHGDA